jgi:hypothetical protein
MQDKNCVRRCQKASLTMTDMLFFAENSRGKIVAKSIDKVIEKGVALIAR